MAKLIVYDLDFYICDHPKVKYFVKSVKDFNCVSQHNLHSHVKTYCSLRSGFRLFQAPYELRPIFYEIVCQNHF